MAQHKPFPWGHTHVVREGIGSDPHNGLSQHLSLVVNTFDGQEDLGEGRGLHVKTKRTAGEGTGRAPPHDPGLTLRRARAAMT